MLFRSLVHAGSPALAVLAAVCYLNRYLSREEPFWSYAGSAMIAFLCGVETKTQDLVGPVWLAFSAILFELGLRKSLPEFRIQAYLLAPFSAAATLALLPDEGGNWRLMVLGAFAYANAWRAIPETSTLEPWERSMLRRAGSSALTLSTAILIHRIALDRKSTRLNSSH